MKNKVLKDSFRNILSSAGVNVNGKEPWDIRVHNDKFYRKVMTGGTLAVGKSYMDGWWDCESLDQFFFKILRHKVASRSFQKKHSILSTLRAKLTNRQRKSRAADVVGEHYNIGNELYKRMLGESMAYSCGYWKEAASLDEAQYAKYDLICRKIGLEPGMNILDIGCGWGAFLKYAAQTYGISGVGITVSNEQVKLGREICNGLPIEIRLQDYRKLDDKFDHIVSIGMFEHVGVKNYSQYFNSVVNYLKPDGLFLLHTIGGNRSVESTNPWINKYIFPDSHLPSLKQLSTAIEGKFIVEDLHIFGTDYDKTLMEWYENFSKSWNDIKKDYDDRFYRMWSYYLLSSAGAFRARYIQLWQFVFSGGGLTKGYRSLR